MSRAALFVCILSGAVVTLSPPIHRAGQATERLSAEHGRAANWKPGIDHSLTNGDTSMIVDLFLCGDLMTGRGIDQALPHSVDPTLAETYVKDARAYVELAERHSGSLPDSIGFDYIWGDALSELRGAAPDVRVINLETAVTERGDPWRNKGIHYRMHPDNAGVLKAAGIDCAVLANNHVLDWGYVGLTETLNTLERAGVLVVGAGSDRAAAERPAVLPCDNGARVLVYGCGLPSGGVPHAWAAREDRAGVNFFPRLDRHAVDRIGETVSEVRRKTDIVVVSIHWGSNWGYDISNEQIESAHRLVDEAGAHILHGHSSHHVKGFEVYRNRLILYGCGDFFNDYEGISGHERYRPDLSLMYFPRLDARTGNLVALRMVPMRIERFRLNRVSRVDAEWLRDTLNRECERFDVQVHLLDDQTLVARWP
jgi:poly-gamma-glutamate synthesis protein (capsule biosynthesis protein)